MKIIRSLNNKHLPKGLVFFDIETTGLTPQTSSVFLIGIMREEEQGCVITQLFSESPEKEKEILDDFITLLSPEETLIHYNGTTFDIPYLNRKFRKYGINRSIDASLTRDIYKELIHYKKYLPTENLKLKTIEAAADYKRTDTFDGSELIQLYAKYLGIARLTDITQSPAHKASMNTMLQAILLHNSDDLEGLYRVFQATNIFDALSGVSEPTVEITPFEIVFTYPSPLFPAVFEFNMPGFCINNGNKACEVTVPVKTGEFKYFFSDYKNYTYIIDRDMCMHNSVVSGIAKENKKKCTRDTAYIKKEGRFIPIPAALTDTAAERNMRLFKENFNDKGFYAELNEDEDFLRLYITALLKTM